MHVCIQAVRQELTLLTFKKSLLTEKKKTSGILFFCIAMFWGASKYLNGLVKKITYSINDLKLIGILVVQGTATALQKEVRRRRSALTPEKVLYTLKDFYKVAWSFYRKI